MKNRRIKLLLIEDRLSDAQRVKEILSEVSSIQFEIVLASSLPEALKLMQNPDLDVILLDLNLPESQRLGILLEIRIRTDLPIVIVTGIDNEKLGDEAVRAGAQDFLPKNRLDGVSLVRSLRYAIERARAEAETVTFRRRYKELFDNVVIGLFRSTPGPKGTFVDVNPTMVEMFDADNREQLLAVSPSEIYLDPNQRRIFSDTIMSKGSIKDEEVQLKTLKGRPLWGRITAVKKVDMYGQFYFDNTIEDITTRKQTEEALEHRNSILVTLNKLAIGLASLPSSADIHDFAVKRLMEITGAVAAAFSEYDPGDRVLVTKNLEIAPGLLEKFYRLLGKRLLDIRSPVDDQSYKEIVTTIVGTRKTLTECSFGAIPSLVGSAVQKLIGADHFIGVAYVVEGQLYGTSLIAMKAGSPEPPFDLLESFASLVAVSLRRRRVEEALRESEARLKDAQALGRIGNWEHDLVNQRIIWSDQTYRLYGRNPALGPPTAKEEAAYYTPDQNRKLREFARLAVEEGKESKYDLEATLPDGTLAYFSATMQPQKDASGAVVKLFGTVQDITERNLAVEALEESEEKYRTLVERANDGIIIIQDGILKFVNSKMAEIDGTSVEELLGTPFTVHVHPDDLPKVAEYYRKRMAGEPVPNIYEALLRRRDGRAVYAELNAGIIVYQGRPANLVIIRDITQRKQAEEALRTREAQLSDALQMSHAGNWDYDVASDTFTFNDNFYRIFHTNAADVGGYKMKSSEYARRFCHPDDMPMVGQEVKASIETTDPNFSRQLEHRIIYADGGVGYISVRFSITKDAQGRTVKTHGVNQDITELKQAEIALRNSEQKHRNVVEYANEGIVIAKKGCLSYANPRALEFLQCSHDEILNRPFTDFVHPDDQKVVFERYQRRVKGEDVPTNYDFRVIGLKGRLTWVQISSVAISWENEPSTLNFLMDITERKQIEKDLLSSREALRDLVENVNDVLYTVDRNGTLTYISTAIERITGYKPSDLVGKPYLSFVHKDDVSEIMASFRDVMNNLLHPSEFRILCKTGEIRWVRTSSRPIIENGNVVGLRGVLVDITEHKLAEQEKENLQAQLLQSQKMEAVGRLAGGIAHDFNNLLTVITGYCDIVLKSMDEQNPLWKTISKIKQSGERAAGLTRQLLAFSRRQAFSPRLVDLNTVVNDSKEMLARLIGENIDLLTALDPELKPVMADPGLIGQVIMNLAVNSRDAMPNGGTLSISTENTELSLEYAREHPDVKPGPHVMLAVSDTGCGMSNEVKEHLFEPFFTTKAKDKGSGLGLSTVYGIVKQSNGHINVYTEVGHGTTFRIYFPIPQSVAADVQSDELKTTSAEKGSETILVVEDESGVRDLIVDVLESTGYTVLAASDGEKAEKLCQKHPSPIHLLITDMVLPRMSGRDVAMKCLQYHSKAKVLFMSGYTDDVIFHSGALDPGMAFIEKPFTPDAFLHKVREVLST